MAVKLVHPELGEIRVSFAHNQKTQEMQHFETGVPFRIIGLTYCAIYRPTGKDSRDLFAEADSLCAEGDIFSKRFGRKQAFTRALSQIKDRALRKFIGDGVRASGMHF